MAGLKAGDRVIIREIYSKLLPQVQSWIIKNGGDQAAANDVFQETLETILLKIDEVHTSFGGLVVRIAKNKWIDKVRKEQRSKVVRKEDWERLEDEINVAHELEQKEQEYHRFRLMEMEFDKLSDLCKQLIQKIKAGVPVTEMIEQLGFASANTLYRRKAACMERWASLVKKNPQYYFGQ